MRLSLSLPTALRNTIGTFTGRRRYIDFVRRLVILRHHKAYLDWTAGDFRKDRANQIDETPFQMRFSKRRRYAHHKYAILERKCGCTLKPGCENGWLNF